MSWTKLRCFYISVNAKANKAFQQNFQLIWCARVVMQNANHLDIMWKTKRLINKRKRKRNCLEFWHEKWLITKLFPPMCWNNTCVKEALITYYVYLINKWSNKEDYKRWKQNHLLFVSPILHLKLLFWN